METSPSEGHDFVHTPPPLLRSYLMHSSGGLVWHGRALFNRAHWQPLLQSLDVWLDQWLEILPPHQRSLILIGPSAGWTLPQKFISHFENIIAFEPDIIARTLFHFRFRHKNLRFENFDVFSPGGMDYLLQKSPSCAVLFCNVLGQLSPCDATAADAWCRQLTHQLKNHHWASYHDRISTTSKPTAGTELIKSPTFFAADTPLEEVISRYWQQDKIEVCDHFTEKLAENLPFQCVPWHLKKNQIHLIEFIFSSPRL